MFIVSAKTGNAHRFPAGHKDAALLKQFVERYRTQ
jgi:hypothetical protein